jgi:hypothetical protein
LGHIAEGRRKKEEGRRKKEEGRGNNSNGLNDLECPNHLGNCYNCTILDFSVEKFTTRQAGKVSRKSK